MYSVSSVVSQTAIMKTVIIEDKQRIESIILHCDACFVGITDLEGSKLEMLEHNNNVCITFSVGHKLVYQHEKVACSYSMRSESAMCRGQVEFIEEIDEKRRALDIIMRHYTDSEFNYSDPAVRNVKVWQVRINQMTGKVFGLRANEKP